MPDNDFQKSTGRILLSRVLLTVSHCSDYEVFAAYLPVLAVMINSCNTLHFR